MVSNAFCWSRDRTYEVLARAGALAFIIRRNAKLPGVDTFFHSSWDPVGANSGRAMPFVHAGMFGFDATALDGTTSLSLGSPHNDEYFRLYTSPLWLIGCQVLASVFGCLVSIVAFA